MWDANKVNFEWQFDFQWEWHRDRPNDDTFLPLKMFHDISEKPYRLKQMVSKNQETFMKSAELEINPDLHTNIGLAREWGRIVNQHGTNTKIYTLNR